MSDARLVLVEEPDIDAIKDAVQAIETGLASPSSLASPASTEQLLECGTVVIGKAASMLDRGSSKDEVLAYLKTLGGTSDVMAPFVERADEIRNSPVNKALNAPPPPAPRLRWWMIGAAVAVAVAVGFALFQTYSSRADSNQRDFRLASGIGAGAGA